MKLNLVAAVCVLAVVPAFAQAPKAPKPTKADAQKVLASISADKGKMQTFCDLGKLNDQMGALDEKKDAKKLEALGKQADALAQKLGPDYAKLMDGMEQLDEKSADGKDIMAAFENLGKQCK